MDYELIEQAYAIVWGEKKMFLRSSKFLGLSLMLGFSVGCVGTSKDCGQKEGISPPVTKSRVAGASKDSGNDLKAEAPKAEAPKAEAPEAEAPKAEAPKAEAPKAEAPKAEVEKTKGKSKKKNAPSSTEAKNKTKEAIKVETSKPTESAKQPTGESSPADTKTTEPVK